MGVCTRRIAPAPPLTLPGSRQYENTQQFVDIWDGRGVANDGERYDSISFNDLSARVQPR